MPIGIGPALAIAGGSILGAGIAGSAAKSAASSGANAQLEAARIGAQAGAFRPVNVSTRFGQSQFVTETDPATGLPVLKEAGYTLTPEMAALQEQLLGLAPGSLTRAASAYERAAPVEAAVPGLFALGGEFLGATPEEIRRQYIEDQLAVLEPGRIREEQRLERTSFGRGRTGLNIGDIGNPDLYSLAAARRQQELGLAAGAEEAVRQRISTGTGLFGTGMNLLGTVPAYEAAALSPFSSYLSGAQNIEALGQEPLRLGAELGGRQSTAGAQAGQLLAQGGANAANLRMQGSLVGPTMFAGTTNALLSNPYVARSLFGNTGSSVSGNASWMNDPWMQ